MSVMALQTTISTGIGRISDLGSVAYGREGSRVPASTRPLWLIDNAHWTKSIAVTTAGSSGSSPGLELLRFGLTRPRSLPLRLIHGWRIHRDPDNPPLGTYPAGARGRAPAAAGLAG